MTELEQANARREWDDLDMTEQDYLDKVDRAAGIPTDADIAKAIKLKSDFMAQGISEVEAIKRTNDTMGW